MDAFKFNPPEPKPTEPGNYITHVQEYTSGGFYEEVYFDGVVWRYRDNLTECYLQIRSWLPVEVIV